jgi:hypothetical protein
MASGGGAVLDLIWSVSIVRREKGNGKLTGGGGYCKISVQERWGGGRAIVQNYCSI